VKIAPFLVALTVGAAAALAPTAAAAPAKKASASIDWSKRVATTPEGGFVMGNPAAKVKLVEYGSLTCGHCANFSTAAKAPLAARVRTGKVSFEFRNYVLNGRDIAASMVARCGGTARFFPLTEAFFATQAQWIDKIGAVPPAQQQQIQALPEGQRLVRIAAIGGLTQAAAQAGLTPARTNACLSDPAALRRLIQMAEAAEAKGVNGTPTFFINGVQAPANDWRGIEALIIKAGG
jgi:protein-disulfide isomerase